jgi:hypothetical protein
MEEPRQPDRNLTLGLTPVALWCLGPLVIIGVASAANRLFMLLLNLFR